MKVKFCCDNNANIHSTEEQIFDTFKDLKMTDDEWNALSDDEKNQMVENWAMERFEWWFEEIKP